MIYRKLFILLCLFFFGFSSCTSIKNALTGKRAENSDEFLINKKNPLILPPDYEDLPEPKDESLGDLAENEIDIEELIGIYNDDQDNTDSESHESIEQFVLDNINKN